MKTNTRAFYDPSKLETIALLQMIVDLNIVENSKYALIAQIFSSNLIKVIYT